MDDKIEGLTKNQVSVIKKNCFMQKLGFIFLFGIFLPVIAFFILNAYHQYLFKGKITSEPAIKVTFFMAIGYIVIFLIIEIICLCKMKSKEWEDIIYHIKHIGCAELKSLKNHYNIFAPAVAKACSVKTQSMIVITLIIFIIPVMVTTVVYVPSLRKGQMLRDEQTITVNEEIEKVKQLFPSSEYIVGINDYVYENKHYYAAKAENYEGSKSFELVFFRETQKVERINSICCFDSRKSIDENIEESQEFINEMIEIADRSGIQLKSDSYKQIIPFPDKFNEGLIKANGERYIYQVENNGKCSYIEYNPASIKDGIPQSLSLRTDL